MKTAVNTMKGYLVFAAVGETGDGGWHDFAGSFDDESEAVSFAHKNYSGAGWWWHVVDLRSNKIIRSSV